MKILLINPNIIFHKTGLPKHSNYPPMGLCCIAAFLEKENYQVKILDAKALNLNEEQFIKEVKEINPDMIGFISYLANYNSMLKAIDIVKKINKDIKIIVGGPNASSVKENIMHDSKNIDFIITGEGECTILELIHALEKNKPLNKIKGLIYKKGKKIINNGARPWIQDLDKLPIPARHLLPDISNNNIYDSSFRHKRLPVTSIITSRGCPYQCLFCDKQQGNKFRAHSAKRVIEEIKHLISKYGIKEVFIFDATFIVDVKRVKEICNTIIKEKIDITWSCNGRIDIIYRNKELIPLMKKAGCWYMSFGIESGNQKVLDYLKKSITLEQTRDVIKWVHKNRMISGGYFILGCPIDTKETMNDTINFAKSLPLDTAQFSLMVPYPGTELYKLAQKKGKMNKLDYEKTTGRSGHPAYIPEGLTEEYLIKIQKKAFKEFVFRPIYLLRQLRNISNIYMLKNYLKTGKRYFKTLFLK